MRVSPINNLYCVEILPIIEVEIGGRCIYVAAFYPYYASAIIEKMKFAGCWRRTLSEVLPRFKATGKVGGSLLLYEIKHFLQARRFTDFRKDSPVLTTVYPQVLTFTTRALLR
jgi:hypothetical protein